VGAELCSGSQQNSSNFDSFAVYTFSNLISITAGKRSLFDRPSERRSTEWGARKVAAMYAFGFAPFAKAPLMAGMSSSNAASSSSLSSLGPAHAWKEAPRISIKVTSCLSIPRPSGYGASSRPHSYFTLVQ
jgi:hypothetical protein